MKLRWLLIYSLSVRRFFFLPGMAYVPCPFAAGFMKLRWLLIYSLSVRRFFFLPGMAYVPCP
ncbi:MAG: hypothetical protein E7B29_12875, partial [Mixta calida]|nr:hypothetical protein [Mixta calida]